MIQKIRNIQTSLVTLLRKYPIWSLAVFFFVFVALIVGSLFLSPTVTPELEQTEQALPVMALRFGEGEVTEDTVGTIENTTTLTLVAQSAGPISKIELREGAQVSRGSVIARQETAYAAGNAATVQKNIAGQNYQLADASLKNTVEVVSKTREQADLLRTNAEELRKISERSISDTEGYIKNLERQYDQLEDLLESVSGFPDLEVQYRGSLISTQSFLNQSRTGLEQLKYSVNTSNPPTKLEDLQRDIIYKSTEMQLKAAEVQKKIAGLSYQSAKIAEAATRVTAPIAGTVQRVMVSEGEYVNPGTPVAVITGQAELQLKISVSGAVATRIDSENALYVTLGDQVVALPISHVSSVPVTGQLFEVIAAIPSGYENAIFEGQAVKVTLPLYSVSIVGGNYFIPLDSVFITNTDTFVFVEEEGRAKKKSVEVGSIVSSAIEIKNGLVPGDVIILDRRVIEKQLLEVELVTSPTAVVQELG